MRRKSKKILTEFIASLVVFVILLYFTIPKFLDAQTINDEDHFPDPAFRVSVEEFMGVKPGGAFSASKAARKGGLLRCGENVRDLTGLEYFQSLTDIRCWTTQVSNVDFSKNPALTTIELVNSPISSLDFSKNTNLKNLICFKLKLTELDVSRNPNLVKLHCMENQLTGIDVSSNPELRELICRDNPITQLDLSKNSELRYLCCDNNLLTELDVTKNPGLDALYCLENRLTRLDVSKNPYLKYLNCKNNQISELILCASPVLEYADLSQNLLPSIQPFIGIKTLYFLDISYNDLDKGDWPDVQKILEYFTQSPPPLIKKRGVNDKLGFSFSPQNDINPYP